MTTYINKGLVTKVAKLADRINNPKTNAWTRAQAALELSELAKVELAVKAGDARRAAFRELRDSSYTLAEMAEVFGITESRISQIVKGPE